MLQVIARCGGEAKLIANEVLEDSAGVASDGAMGFIRNDQIKIRGREEPLVLVVEQQRLHRCNHDFRTPPVIAVFLVDNRLKVSRKQPFECLPSLVLKFEAIDQKEYTPGVTRTEKELNDGCCRESLASTCSHLKQEAVFPIFYSAL